MAMRLIGRRARLMGAVAFLACLCSCSGKRIASIDGVRSVKLQGTTVVIDMDVREPISAPDASIALGQAISAVARRLGGGLPADVPASTTHVLIRAAFVTPGWSSGDSFTPGQSVRIPFAALRRAGRTELTPQAGLDLTQSIGFSSVPAASGAAIFCSDPAHMVASPAYCQMVRITAARDIER